MNQVFDTGKSVAMAAVGLVLALSIAIVTLGVVLNVVKKLLF